LQFLHCLKYDASVEGGDNTFADSVYVGETIRSRNPAAFDLLTSTPISYHYLTGGATLLLIVVSMFLTLA